MVKISCFKIHNFKGKFFITLGDICDDESIAKALKLKLDKYIELARMVNGDVQYNEFVFFNNEDDTKKFISILEEKLNKK